jgi:hypothetical protein
VDPRRISPPLEHEVIEIEPIAEIMMQPRPTPRDPVQRKTRLAKQD